LLRLLAVGDNGDMQRPFQFPLYKIFLITAVFALTIRLAQYAGPEHWPFAAPLGAVGTLLVVFMNRRNLVDAILTAVVALMGAYIGGPLILTIVEAIDHSNILGHPTTTRGLITLAALLGGALAGTVLALVLQWISDHIPTR
jgi:hypothetical protein